jgi:D-2-hydroxyacid dehydrogenase (NADP+)
VNFLVLLTTLPEADKRAYYDGIRDAFPTESVDLASTIPEADQYLGRSEILITFGPHMGAHADGVVRKAANLKWIQALGTGVDNIVDLPSLKPEVLVTNVHGLHGVPMTEAALLSMLALARDFPRLFRYQQERRWERFPPRLLAGKTVGIFGIGAIAASLAPACKALGMRVIGISSVKREVAGFDRVYARDALREAVRELDFFILLTPYTAQTRNIVDAQIFAAMKPGCHLVNLARGGIVDEAALIAALRQKRIAGAALDVFSEEPLSPESPFWAMENVIISPHLGGFNSDYVSQTLPIVTENIRRFLAGDFDNMLCVVRKGACHGR